MALGPDHIFTSSIETQNLSYIVIFSDLTLLYLCCVASILERRKKDENSKLQFPQADYHQCYSPDL